MKGYENEYDPFVVTMSMERYEELLRKAEHYDNIVEAALVNATLSSWKDELDLDTGTVEKYLLIVEAAKAAAVKSGLLREREIRERQAEEAKE